MVNVHINHYQGKNIHFIGIGGISMSGLAHILLSNGYRVSGSDMKASPITDHLQEEGVVFHEGHKAQYVEGADLVVHTAAVKDDNPEMVQARKLHIPIIDRATLLGQIMEQYPYAIGVSGTHGKTTVTSIISTIMEQGGMDPTIHIGGELDLIGGTTKAGKGPHFITEACEYVESFLKFRPTIAVVLNIEEDHLDYFRDLDHIYQSFQKYVSLVPPEGYLVGNGDDPLVQRLMKEAQCRTISYGLQPHCDWTARDVTWNVSGYPSFTAYYKGKEFGRFDLAVPGQHNVYNALASIATVSIFHLPAEKVQKSIHNYRGAHRRFERQGEIDGVTIIHDYAHHPTEIRATLKAASLLPHSRMWCIFQPHTYSRTKKLFDEFLTAFDGTDSLIITDIYAAREKNSWDIHARDLAKAIESAGKHCTYISSFEDIAQYLHTNWHPGDIVLTLGAGDIEGIGKILLEERKETAYQ
jgi:UDP-N-acetylmuramate--alanine ligase